MSAHEPVGTLAEEAAKLLAAVHGWVGDAGAPAHDPGGGADDESGGDHGHDPHDAAECRWCPLCQLARMAKATSPDVREHLSQAAISLALALKGLLDDSSTVARRATPLEKIDLTEE